LGVFTDTGSKVYTFAFDPITMQKTRLYVSSFPTSNGMVISPADGVSWSYTNSQLLYVQLVSQVLSYDFTNRSTPPSSTVVADFRFSSSFNANGPSPNCLPSGFSETWNSNGGFNKFGSPLIFHAAFSSAGGQGTGVWAGVIKPGSGCSMLNTSTGQVIGDWGVTGTVTDFSGNPQPDRFTIHNVKSSKDGQYMFIAITTCTSVPANCTQNAIPTSGKWEP
jgi:hypothetical protein